MKTQTLFLIFFLVLLCSKCNSQGTTTNGTTDGSTNSTINGQTNGTTNGQKNGTTNGQTNGTSTQTVETVQCTKPCEQLSYNTCTLCSQMCKNLTSGEVTSYKLTTCQFKECKLWKSQPRSQQDPTNTETICAEWETKLLSQQQCGPSCCEQSFATFTYQNYQKCVQTNADKSSFDNQVSIIIAAVLSSVLGSIVIIVILICCRSRISLCCKNFIYAIQTLFIKDSIKKHRDTNSTQQSDHHEHSHQKNDKLKWETIPTKRQVSELPTSKYIIQSQYDINPQIYCSICLDSGLNTETHCEHHFHLSCLRKKMAKKMSCPECKSKDFNPMKISCDMCLQKQTKFYMTKSNADYQPPAFFINNKIYCDNCMKKNIQSGHIKLKSKA